MVIFKNNISMIPILFGRPPLDPFTTAHSLNMGYLMPYHASAYHANGTAAGLSSVVSFCFSPLFSTGMRLNMSAAQRNGVE
jgi:hypothetical protein